MIDGWQVRHRSGSWGRKRTSKPRVEWHEMKTGVFYLQEQAGALGGGAAASITARTGMESVVRVGRVEKEREKSAEVLAREQNCFAGHASRMNYQAIARRGWRLGRGGISLSSEAVPL
jgi:hypothetical protein